MGTKRLLHDVLLCIFSAWKCVVCRLCLNNFRLGVLGDMEMSLRLMSLAIF